MLIYGGSRVGIGFANGFLFRVGLELVDRRLTAHLRWAGDVDVWI